MLSYRFKTMYRQLGLTRFQAAQLLHVSERTLHNWDTGHHEIPYSAYKLMRLLSFSELPGQAWDGWHFAAGQLWSPEGYGFKPTDSKWWSNLCRRSHLFHVLYRENQQIKLDLQKAASVTELADASASAVALDGPGSEGGEVPVTLHLSLIPETFKPKIAAHGGTPERQNAPSNRDENCPAEARFSRVRYSLHLQKGGV